MQHRNSANSAAQPCRDLWLQVCRSRGTPLPDPAEVMRFLGGLPEEAQSELEQALRLCLNGREKHRELACLSWAAACTRPALIAQVRSHGLECSGPLLFAAGVGLMAAGWDMSARVAQLAVNAHDVEALGAALALQGQLDGPVGLQNEPDPAPRLDFEELPELSFSIRQGREDALPNLPEQAVPTPAADATLAAPGMQELIDDIDDHDYQDHEEREEPGPIPLRSPARLQLKLYGKEAAHTLEAGPHRRGGGFMGAHVVTIESARALPGGGYDWGRKLAVQLTPEEMPAALAVLMNLAESVRFGQHGAQRDKFVELRRQAGGLLVVTSQGGAAYAVPVRTGALYYLLALFARAIAQGLPGGSVAEVLALVRASQ